MPTAVKLVEELEDFKRWWKKPKEGRETQEALAKRLGVSVPTISYWIKHKTTEDYEDPLLDEIKHVVKAIEKSALQGNANAQKLYLQFKGVLNERSQETPVYIVTADEYFRIREEAKRRIAEVVSGAANGMGGSIPVASVLPDQVRVSSEQERGESTKVAAVAVSQ